MLTEKFNFPFMQNIVNEITWKQLISLYPHLVELTASDSAQIGRALRTALWQYADLLQPPSGTVTTNGNVFENKG